MSDFASIAHALRALDPPGSTEPHPLHIAESGALKSAQVARASGMETTGRDETSQARGLTDSCTDCGDTGWHHRSEDGAPIPCWCESGDAAWKQMRDAR